MFKVVLRIKDPLIICYLTSRKKQIKTTTKKPNQVKPKPKLNLRSSEPIDETCFLDTPWYNLSHGQHMTVVPACVLFVWPFFPFPCGTGWCICVYICCLGLLNDC